MGGGGEKHGKGPKAHPVFKDEVFTPWEFRILSAWNAENGELIWRKVPGKAYGKPHAYWGVSNSPLVLDNQLINLFGNDEKGALISLIVIPVKLTGLFPVVEPVTLHQRMAFLTA